ncbi:hypothetical protein E2C01_072650 [Portunus trituberculatus]|uniref:Uncharacterized protein n=1 Tax=Portunus trituberculatus TaxID=210409 RepID=A0A5B7IBA5_PORTR|nr:hypothetical protein [Portunus trituberculatus]
MFFFSYFLRFRLLFSFCRFFVFLFFSFCICVKFYLLYLLFQCIPSHFCSFFNIIFSSSVFLYFNTQFQAVYLSVTFVLPPIPSPPASSRCAPLCFAGCGGPCDCILYLKDPRAPPSGTVYAAVGEGRAGAEWGFGVRASWEEVEEEGRCWLVYTDRLAFRLQRRKHGIWQFFISVILTTTTTTGNHHHHHRNHHPLINSRQDESFLFQHSIFACTCQLLVPSFQVMPLQPTPLFY